MNPNWLDRLHSLAAGRERAASAVLARRVQTFHKAKHACETLDAWARQQRSALDDAQASAWDEFMGGRIDHVALARHEAREAMQALERDTLAGQLAEADATLQSADSDRHEAMRTYAARQRRLLALETLRDQHRIRAVQRAQLREEDDMLPQPIQVWKDRH
ncbi:hypothetical protein [Pseudomonas sp. Marseille-QA0892]